MKSRYKFLTRVVALTLLVALVGVFQVPLLAAQAPPLPDLAVDKGIAGGGESISPGQPVRFEITVKNLGEGAVQAVTVQDVYDQAALRISGIQEDRGEGWVDSSPSEGPGELTWMNIELEPGQIWQAHYTATLALPFTFIPTAGGDGLNPRSEIANTAIVLAGDREVASKTHRIYVPLPPSGLSVRKTASGDGGIGSDGKARFMLTVENATEGLTFRNLTVSDQFTGQEAVPQIAGGVDVLDSSLLSEAVLYEQKSDRIIWTLDRLAPGEAWSVEYQTTIEPFFEQGNREITNEAILYLSTEGGDHVLDRSETLQLKVKQPQLALSREIQSSGDGEEFRPGDTAVFKLLYSNTGTAPATGVRLEESLDEQIMDGQITIDDGGTRNGALIAWDLGQVAAGEVGEVSYWVRLSPELLLKDAGKEFQISNKAALSGQGFDTVAEVDPPTVVVRTPIVELTGYQMGDLNGGKVQPGDVLRFVVDLENAGTVVASPVAVRVLYDEGLSRVVSQDGIPADAGMVEWRIGKLGPGESRSIVYDLLIDKVEKTGGGQLHIQVLNAVSILIGEAEVARSSQPITVEPVPTPTPTAAPTPVPAPVAVAEDTIPFEQQNFEKLAILIGGLMLGSLAIVGYIGYQTMTLLKAEGFKEHFREIVEMFTILIIVSAVLILAMASELGPTPAVGVLSGIAGYVLGRGGRA